MKLGLCISLFWQVTYIPVRWLRKALWLNRKK